MHDEDAAWMDSSVSLSLRSLKTSPFHAASPSQTVTEQDCKNPTSAIAPFLLFSVHERRQPSAQPAKTRLLLAVMAKMSPGGREVANQHIQCNPQVFAGGVQTLLLLAVMGNHTC